MQNRKITGYAALALAAAFCADLFLYILLRIMEAQKSPTPAVEAETMR